VTRGGRPVRILLPLGAGLRHGDVLADDGACLVVVHVEPADVLVVRPRTPAELARVALEIGNLHAPVAVDGDELLVIPDGPIEAVLGELGVPHERQARRFIPDRLIAAPAAAAANDFAITPAVTSAATSAPGAMADSPNGGTS
jgi:urease accessory protein UreE